MIDIIGWLLRSWEPARAARCTSCGERANGKLLRGDYPGTDALVCEHCGKRWNITMGWDDLSR